MDFFGVGRRQTYEGTAFFEEYKAFPAAVFGKSEVEKGNKIILPGSAAERLVRLNISYPMLFRITNRSMGTSTHCGVLEFTAEEGTCGLPYWLMQQLVIVEGSDVLIENVSLPMGNFLKIRPYETAFIDLPNPKAVLETSLRNFSCLTSGETINIEFAGRNFEIEILETRPAEAILTIETDINIEFAAPRDYKEPVRPTTLAPPEPASAPVRKGSSGFRLDGKTPTEPQATEPQGYDPRKHRLTHGVRESKANAKSDYWTTLGQGKKL
jgi:ubiquitin fusion degradation protein 1